MYESMMLLNRCSDDCANIKRAQQPCESGIISEDELPPWRRLAASWGLPRGVLAATIVGRYQAWAGAAAEAPPGHRV